MAGGASRSTARSRRQRAQCASTTSPDQRAVQHRCPVVHHILAAAVTLARSAPRRGERPMMHDKGSAFWSWRGISRFTELLAEMGIDQIVAEHKEWNGKVEVFNGNLHKELFDVQRFSDVAEMPRRLAAHLDWSPTPPSGPPRRGPASLDVVRQRGETRTCSDVPSRTASTERRRRIAIHARPAFSCETSVASSSSLSDPLASLPSGAAPRSTLRQSSCQGEGRRFEPGVSPQCFRRLGCAS
jgi:hypothetical protein